MSTSVDRTQRRHYGQAAARYYSVTQICREMTGGEAYGDQAAMDRGTDLHTIFALAVASFAGRCAPPVVPAAYHGYYASMQQWITHAKPEPVRQEKPAVSAIKGLPFAGTPDLLAYIQYCGKRRLALIDLKSGAAARWHAVQVLAYSKLDGYQGSELQGRLYIYEDGSDPTFTINKPVPQDWAAFQAALSLLIWRES